jgi:16S rRNA (cytosine1402-N4)-methyltransferase
MTGFRHKPVLWRETIDILALKPGMTAVDCTVGGGGHSRMILERILPTGRLVAIDQDPQALAAAEETLTDALGEMKHDGLTDQMGTQGGKPFTMVHSNFAGIKEILAGLGIVEVNAVLMDLGVSSWQFDNGDRGFSYQHLGVLDMRMNPMSDVPTARDVIRDSSAEELEEIFWIYGEERWSKRIAMFIVTEREKAPIDTTEELVKVIKKAIPAGARENGPHPAKRPFMALRIYINKELDILEQAVTDAVDVLAPGGRLAAIGFHSLEDRKLKDTFKKLAAGCTCPKDLPVCACGKTPKGKILTTKPVMPKSDELNDNPRARSARLRAFQKI